MKDISRRLAVIVLAVGCSSFAFADTESNGAAAEKAGRYREALNLYVEALQSATAGSEKDLALRRKIIDVAAKVSPSPGVPEEASRYLARGRAAVGMAKDEQGFERAANEFRQALKLTPWLADAYYNLGVVLDKAGRYAEAIQSLKFYLLTKPSAPDAKQAQELIYQVEYRQEESKRAGVVKKSAATDMARRGSLDNLRGTWILRSEGHRSVWIYDYYFSASIERTNSVRLTYTHVVVVRADKGFENPGIKSKTFSLRIVGNAVSGTYENEFFWVGGCVMRKAEQVSGVLYTDGRQIDLEYWTADIPRGDGCVWGSMPPPQKQRIVLRRQN